MVKTVAEQRAWQHSDHAQLFDAVATITAETGDEDIDRLFEVASIRHTNFYEGWYGTGRVLNPPVDFPEAKPQRSSSPVPRPLRLSEDDGFRQNHPNQPVPAGVLIFPALTAADPAPGGHRHPRARPAQPTAPPGTAPIIPRCADPQRWPAVPARGPFPTASTMASARKIRCSRN